MRQVVAKTARTGIRTLARLRSLLPVVNGARIITYHSVRPDGAGPRSSYVHPADFEAQMRWLVDRGFQIVSLTRLAEAINAGQSIPGNWVAITFDDGYADNYEWAFPVLKRYNILATIFLISGKVNRDAQFLTLNQMKEMAGSGIDYGGHTVDHVSLSSIASSEARHQVFASKRQLEELLSRPIQHFCYPFGHYNAETDRFVREAGYRSCCTEQAGTIVRGTDPFRLVRLGILGTDTIQDFGLKVRGGYDWWINAYMRIEEGRRRKRGGVPN